MLIIQIAKDILLCSLLRRTTTRRLFNSYLRMEPLTQRTEEYPRTNPVSRKPRKTRRKSPRNSTNSSTPPQKEKR